MLISHRGLELLSGYPLHVFHQMREAYFSIQFQSNLMGELNEFPCQTGADTHFEETVRSWYP
jgi:hypothetical protein